MCWIRAGLVGLATILIATAAEAASSVTHKQVQVIKVPKSGGSSLQSMARKSDGRLVALVGRSRYEGIGGNGSGEPVAEIHVFDKEGAKLQKWSLDFAGQAVGAGPDGSIFVGGNGKIAKYDADGKLVIQAELPHMAAILADKGSLTKQAEEQIESERKSIEQTKKVYAAQIKVLKSRIERLNKIDSDELTPSDKRRLKRYQDQLQAYESVKFDEGASEQKIEAVIQQLIQRAMMISGVSANENDVFVVCGEQKGYGFATWRMDQEFKNPTKVLSELRGCCGQMDVQAFGDQLFVAENTKHCVGQYDRDGKSVAEFGERAGRKASDGFGGCCNPMNLCIGPEGQIFTAESEGIIRRFSASGEAMGMVGKVTLSGGCKNVAVAVSPDGENVYFCDLPGSRIIVLGRITDEEEAEALTKKLNKQAPPVVQEAEEDAEDAASQSTGESE